jgi:hypothetical protein
MRADSDELKLDVGLWRPYERHERPPRRRVGRFFEDADNPPRAVAAAAQGSHRDGDPAASGAGSKWRTSATAKRAPGEPTAPISPGRAPRGEVRKPSARRQSRRRGHRLYARRLAGRR